MISEGSSEKPLEHFGATGVYIIGSIPWSRPVPTSENWYKSLGLQAPSDKVFGVGAMFGSSHTEPEEV